MNINWSLLLSAVALAIIFESLAYILLPEKMQQALKELACMEPSRLRQYGFLALAAGLIFLIIIRS